MKIDYSIFNTNKMQVVVFIYTNFLTPVPEQAVSHFVEEKIGCFVKYHIEKNREAVIIILDTLLRRLGKLEKNT